MKNSPVRFLLVLVLILAGFMETGRANGFEVNQVGSDKVVIANAQTHRVVVAFSDDLAEWWQVTFAARTTREVAYAQHVRIVSENNEGERVVYQNTLSPAGKYVIVKEAGGRLVLRVPHPDADRAAR